MTALKKFPAPSWGFILFFSMFVIPTQALIAQDDNGDIALRVADRMSKANDLLDKGDYQGARAQILKVTELDPNNSRAWLMLGGIDENLQANDGEALKAFQTYLKLVPDTKKKAKLKQEIAALENKLEDEKDSNPQASSGNEESPQDRLLGTWVLMPNPNMKKHSRKKIHLVISKTKDGSYVLYCVECKRGNPLQVSGNHVTSIDNNGQETITTELDLSEDGNSLTGTAVHSDNPSAVVNVAYTKESTRTGGMNLERVTPSTVSFAGNQWNNFTVKVADSNGNPVQGIKVAWETPAGGNRAYVAVTDGEGACSATNLYTFPSGGPYEQVAYVVSPDTATGFTAHENLAVMGSMVKFQFTQH